MALLTEVNRMTEFKKHWYALFYAAMVKTPRRYRCEGFDFHGGAVKDAYDLQQPWWMVTQNCVMPLPKESGYVHVNSRGWFFEVEPVEELTLPFLLTNDPNIRQVYNGPVVAQIPREEDEQVEAPILSYSLVGEDWVGILWERNKGCHLTAYSHKAMEPGVPYRAYDSDWADSFDDDDPPIFVVTLP